MHLNNVDDKKHQAVREQRGATNPADHMTQSKISPSTSSVSKKNLEHQHKQKSHSASKTVKPLQWTLVIDTCCLVGDNGVAAAEDLIKIANNATKNRAEGESIDVVIPFKVWGELEYQSKRKDSPQTAFEARSAMRLLREKLEQNNAAANNNSRNILRSKANVNTGGGVNIIRSQTILDTREAAKKFLSKDFRESTNDDHILACAMLEKERALRLPYRDLEVVILTRDNNLAVSGIFNSLQLCPRSNIWFITCFELVTVQGIC